MPRGRKPSNPALTQRDGRLASRLEGRDRFARTVKVRRGLPRRLLDGVTLPVYQVLGSGANAVTSIQDRTYDEGAGVFTLSLSLVRRRGFWCRGGTR